MNSSSDRKGIHHLATKADELIHEAHDALERMNTHLTLAEAKVALVRDLLQRRRLRERDHADSAIVPPRA